MECSQKKECSVKQETDDPGQIKLAWRISGQQLAVTDRPLLLGIVNVTPDSFSDGGQWATADAAVAHALRLVEEGADMLDIGGESTRPGAEPVPREEELRRVVPVVEQLAKQFRVPISIDTSKAEVARQALAVGAAIINDVTGLTGDPLMPAVAAQFRAGVIVMHMQGTPQTMQQNPTYDDVVREVHAWFQQRLASLAEAGIEAERVVLDPGIGFGKRLEHNLELLARGREFLDLNRPICLGVSRKGFINRLLGKQGWVEHGCAGTIGVLLQAMSQGAVHVARVHDVGPVHDAIRLFAAVDDAAKRHD
jgi:dihydropteroate synthase